MRGVKGETAEGFFFPEGKTPGPSENIRRTVAEQFAESCQVDIVDLPFGNGGHGAVSKLRS